MAFVLIASDIEDSMHLQTRFCSEQNIPIVNQLNDPFICVKSFALICSLVISERKCANRSF